MSKNKISAVFAREPVPGSVKTRLARTIGDNKACQVYNHLLIYTLETLSSVGRPVYVYLTQDSHEHFLQDEIYPPNLIVRQQVEGDLGEKMKVMFDELMTEGADQVVLVGSDCPWLSEGHVQRAFDILEEKDLVFGPALDGGYYLIGQSQKSHDVFQDITWSSEFVYDQTKTLMRESGWSFDELDLLSDVDYLGDIQRFLSEVPEAHPTLEKIRPLIAGH